jgi:hypothetical protein
MQNLQVPLSISYRRRLLLNYHECSFTFAGFPPADHAVRNFLTKKCSQAESYKRCYSFLAALFQHVERTLEGPLFDPHLDVSEVAEEFRKLMTLGQTMKEHNEFRREFYDKVVRIAEEKINAPMVWLA